MHIYLLSTYLLTYLSIYLSIYLRTYVSTYLSIYLSSWPPNFLSGHLRLREHQGHERQHLHGGTIGGKDHREEPVLQKGRLPKRRVLGLSVKTVKRWFCQFFLATNPATETWDKGDSDIQCWYLQDKKELS